MRNETPFKIGEELVIEGLAARTLSRNPRFRVVDLKKGGMGVCALVVNVENATPYALKVLCRDLMEDQSSWDRYLQEITIWLALSACSGVVEAICLTRINEIPVVCSRWMAGGSLRILMKSRENHLPYDSFARIVGTLDWVNRCHNIIHRDLKPENVLLDEQGRAFVSDWGLAKPVSKGISDPSGRSLKPTSNMRPELTQAGSFLGTVWYTAPEQILNAKDVDHRADIYALGCILFEWESGRPPFIGSSAEEIALKHLFEKPSSIGTLSHRSTFGLDEVIGTCLEKEPDDRFPDYHSLAVALSQAAARRSVSVSPFSPSVRNDVLPTQPEEPSEYLASHGKSITWEEQRTHFYAEADDLLPYLERAQDLINIGDFKAAKKIYDGFFIEELVTIAPDHVRNQVIANNYSLCLIECGEPEKAIRVLGSIEKAEQKPAEYYVSLSLAHLRCQSFAEAEKVASAGLVVYSGDPDLIGNLLIAQTQQKKFKEAASNANLRLRQKRDVHSLQEVAELHRAYSREILDLDWPLAFETLRFAIGLLREAKGMNPRYLPVRAGLISALSDITAYAVCTKEISAAESLPWNPSDRVFLASVMAHCMDQVNAHARCIEFCDKWLKNLESARQSNIAEAHVIEISRVRAITIIDGFCIGKTKDGVRIVERSSHHFFEAIVKDSVHRKPRDFAYLARLYEWMGKSEEAFDLLNSAQEMWPDYWEFPFARASFLWRAGSVEEALRDSVRATELAPWKTATWRLLAEIHKEMGNESLVLEAANRGDSIQAKRDALSSQFREFWT
jgi:serine/threonine protein kinase